MERLLYGEVDGQTIELGDVDPSVVSTIVLELEPDEDYNGSIEIQGRSMGFDKEADDRPWYPVPYRRRVLDGVASDEAIVSDALTPTGPTLVSIDASGIVARIVQTEDSEDPDGTCKVRWRGVRG